MLQILIKMYPSYGEPPVGQLNKQLRILGEISFDEDPQHVQHQTCTTWQLLQCIVSQYPTERLRLEPPWST